MAMGRRTKQRQQQEQFWVAHSELPRTVAHPFYQRLNQVLEERGFDAFVEEQCKRFYAEAMGRPSLRPGRYFRLLLIGYFEGIEGERGIAWRAADSLALRHFLELELSEAPPDHSTISRTRRLIDVETHQAVFRGVLKLLAEKGLLKGRTWASMPRRWKRMQPCARLCGGIRARITRSFCGGWPRNRESQRRPGSRWRSWIASGRRRDRMTIG